MEKIDIEPDVICCLSFGKRDKGPSLSNKFLIERVVNFYKDKPLPLIIQKDCADFFPKEIEIDKIISNHVVSGEYLDTKEVVRQCVKYCKVHNLKKALVFAHPDHLPRIKKIFNQFDFKFETADTSFCPYDSKSLQIWTRSKIIFLLRELLVYLYYFIKRG